MPIIIFAQSVAVAACLAVLLLVVDHHSRRRFLDWWRRGYLLAIKTTPRTEEEVNLAAQWSLIHGGLAGLVLIILFWLVE